jgi:hypothetical protein
MSGSNLRIKSKTFNFAMAETYSDDEDENEVEHTQDIKN